MSEPETNKGKAASQMASERLNATKEAVRNLENAAGVNRPAQPSPAEPPVSITGNVVPTREWCGNTPPAEPPVSAETNMATVINTATLRALADRTRLEAFTECSLAETIEGTLRQAADALTHLQQERDTRTAERDETRAERDRLPPPLAAQLDLWRENPEAWQAEWQRDHDFKVRLITDRETAASCLQQMREALDALWTWATESRTHLTSDPVPDGLGAQVIAALADPKGPGR